MTTFSLVGQIRSANTNDKKAIKEATKLANAAKKEEANRIKVIKAQFHYNETVKVSDNEYKEISLFRVLDFINSPKVASRFNLVEPLTINDLKDIAPDYFLLKDGTTRKSFAPHVFLVALRNDIIQSLIADK